MDFVNRLQKVMDEMPFSGRGDVVALTRFWEAVSTWKPRLAMYAFILAWAIREPVLVDAFLSEIMSGPLTKCRIFESLHKLAEVKVTYAYLPKRLVRYLKPATVAAAWNPLDVDAAARALQTSFKKNPTLGDKTTVVKALARLPGIGTYSKEHFWRLACYVANKPDPELSFVVMGDGASASKYSRLRAMGFVDMAAVNERLESPLSASMFAYYLCMGNLV